MYPQTDLNRLALRKRVLMTRIRLRRETCAEQVADVVRPVVWVEKTYARWSAVSPVVKMALPAGLLLAKTFLPKAGALFRWAPLAVNFFRAFR